jgi:imidazole glycerol-phosphate synthase subunit HisF
LLKKRLIAVLTFEGGILTRTKKFTPDYRYTQTQVGFEGIDEIVMLDVSRTDRDRSLFLETAMSIADKCYAPTTIGGGIRSVEDANMMFRSYGADKISINTGAINDPSLITEMADKYGSQSVVVSVDVLDDEVVTDCGRRSTGLSAVEWVKEAVDRGAGEILLTSINRDGSLMGYDLPLCEKVANCVPVPTLIHGGAGSWKHLVEGIEAGASGVCTQNIYHFTESSIKAAKAFMNENGVPVRL